MLLLTRLRKYCTRICFYKHILQVTVFHKCFRILVLEVPYLMIMQQSTFEWSYHGIRMDGFVYDKPFQYSKYICLLPSFYEMKISVVF